MPTTVSISDILSGQAKLISDAFDANIKRGDGCWLWTGKLDTGGYGRVWSKGRYHGAHRMTYEFVCGRLPSSIYVCHTCDTRACVRPDHLFAGTAADNNRDMWAKGRGVANGEPFPGESNPAAVLTQRDVDLILALVLRNVPQKVAAEVFDVSITEVSDIVRGKRWKKS